MSYFNKAKEKELEMLPERMEREKESWVNLVDFPIWLILRTLNFGRQHFRGLAKHFSGSNSTLHDRLDRMERWGLVEVRMEETGARPRKTYEITGLGERLLSAYDEVGEIAKTIRREEEAPVEKTSL